MTREKDIGYRGEKIVYEYLEEKLVAWSYDNWTSRLRSRAGFPGFRESEASKADFTYSNDLLTMRTFLEDMGVPVDRTDWNEYTIYHIEVKTTTGRDNHSFRITENQYNMMQDKDRPGEVYMIILVSNINDSKHDIEILLHPWKLVQQGLLKFNFPSTARFKVSENRCFRSWMNIEVRKCRGYRGYLEGSWRPSNSTQQTGMAQMNLTVEFPQHNTSTYFEDDLDRDRNCDDIYLGW